MCANPLKAATSLGGLGLASRFLGGSKPQKPKAMNEPYTTPGIVGGQ